MPPWLRKTIRKVGVFMKWLMATILSGSIVVMSCSTFADTDVGAGAIDKGAEWLGYTRQAKPGDGDACDRIRRLEDLERNFRADTERVAPLIECASAEARVEDLAGKLASQEFLFELSLTETTEQLHQAEAIIYALVNAVSYEESMQALGAAREYIAAREAAGGPK